MTSFLFITRSNTYEQSVSEEVSGTIGSSFSPHNEFGISSSVTYSASQQETMSWTTTQSSENRQSKALMEQKTSESGVTNTGGNIAVLLKVQNRGYQTVTLSNMTISALQVDPKDLTQVQLVSGMDYDTASGSFPTFDITPNGAMIFSEIADVLTVYGVFAEEPMHGGSMVLWFKADPTLSSSAGGLLYDQIITYDDGSSDLLNQYSVIYPDALWIFGDGYARHAFFPTQYQLPEALSFADWHMLVVVAEEETVGGGMKKFSVYFDAQLYGSVSVEPDVRFVTDEPWTFAGPDSAYGLAGEFIGAMDDIRFFRRVLDSEEVKLLYESQE